MRAILLNSPTAQVADGELRLQQFRSDPEVVAFVGHADDPENAVRRLLNRGARALSLAADAAGHQRTR
ncbi:MAG: hypothetical protein ACYCPS_04825 [Candidatus Saccharimonadales bacterium]